MFVLTTKKNNGKWYHVVLQVASKRTSSLPYREKRRFYQSDWYIKRNVVSLSDLGFSLFSFSVQSFVESTKLLSTIHFDRKNIFVTGSFFSFHLRYCLHSWSINEWQSFLLACFMYFKLFTFLEKIFCWMNQAAFHF